MWDVFHVIFTLRLHLCVELRAWNFERKAIFSKSLEWLVDIASSPVDRFHIQLIILMCMVLENVLRMFQ